MFEALYEFLTYTDYAIDSVVGSIGAQDHTVSIGNKTDDDTKAANYFLDHTAKTICGRPYTEYKSAIIRRVLVNGSQAYLEIKDNQAKIS